MDMVDLRDWLKGRDAGGGSPQQEQELKKAPSEPLEELRPENGPGEAWPPQTPSKRSSGTLERSPVQGANAGEAPSPHGPEDSEDREDKKELCVLHAQPFELPE
jgi:hypothetical protein